MEENLKIPIIPKKGHIEKVISREDCIENFKVLENTRFTMLRAITD